LLKAREARRRALLVHVPANVRLGEGLSLAADGNMSRISLAGALAALRADGTQSAHATAIAHQRALARAPAHEDAATRKLRLREAFNEAVAATPESVLSRLLHGCAPSAGVQWELQRRITSQLGLHALLTHALQLRTLTPETIILRRDAGAAELLEFALVAPTAAHEAASAPSVPFRLTRALQQFITPLGIDGPFSGAFCAAAECFANHSKCPLSQWLDALARRRFGALGRQRCAGGGAHAAALARAAHTRRAKQGALGRRAHGRARQRACPRRGGHQPRRTVCHALRLPGMALRQPRESCPPTSQRRSARRAVGRRHFCEWRTACEAAPQSCACYPLPQLRLRGTRCSGRWSKKRKIIARPQNRLEFHCRAPYRPRYHHR